jgi:hypothetical protein
MYQCTLPYLHVNNRSVVEGFKFFVTSCTIVNVESCTSRNSFITYPCGCSNVKLSIYTWMPCSLFKCGKTFPTNLIFEKTKYYGHISILDIVKVFMMVLKQCWNKKYGNNNLPWIVRGSKMLLMQWPFVKGNKKKSI